MPRTKTTKLSTDVYNLKGDVVGKITLPHEIFAKELNKQLLAQAVRVYQANKRQGTHDTKTRSEVAGSTRKIYRQKGTGRARHGAITAPIFIGGGVAHGPHPRDYSLNFPQKMKQAVLSGVLTDKFQNNGIKIIRGFEKIESKTKKMNEVLNNLVAKNQKKSKKILLVTACNQRNIIYAGRNIQHLTIETAQILNTLEILTHNNLLIMEDAVPVLANRFSKVPAKDILPEKTAKKTIKK